jgi:hypothetical protein
MKSVLHVVVAEARLIGWVTNAFLDDLQVVITLDTTNRDDLTLCRQDAQILTHEDSVARHAERIPLQQVRLDPVLQEQAVLQAQAVKLVGHSIKLSRRKETRRLQS